MLSLVHLQVSFVGESGIDAGGLTREFFHLVFRTLTSESPSICNRQVFHGRCMGHLLPIIDAELVRNWRVFWFVGVVTMQAARAECQGLPGLCDGVRGFLAGGARIDDIRGLIDYLAVDDVADDELRDLLIKVNIRTLVVAQFITAHSVLLHLYVIHIVLCKTVILTRRSSLYSNRRFQYRPKLSHKLQFPKFDASIVVWYRPVNTSTVGLQYFSDGLRNKCSLESSCSRLRSSFHVQDAQRKTKTEGKSCPQDTTNQKLLRCV